MEEIMNLLKLESLFGGKPWWRSLTGWGIVLIVAAQAGFAEACGDNLNILSDSTCQMLDSWLGTGGYAASILGLRRRLA